MGAETAFVQITVRSRDAGEAQRAAAEAFAAGASGLEERDADGEHTLIVYAPETLGAAVYEAARAALDAGGVIGSPERVPTCDWSEHWKRGLAPIVVSPRLRIRPSFVSARAVPGQQELQIDPGQAFGTGGHASTQLVLEWVDALAPALPARGRVLDIGTGSGILALAALSLSRARAFACDLDPLASETAQRNAAANGLADRLHLFTGSLAALADDAQFDLVLANLLRSELEPLIPAIVRLARPAGSVVFSGILAEDRADIGRLAARAGLREHAHRERRDGAGIAWVAPLMRRERAPANPRACARGSC